MSKEKMYLELDFKSGDFYHYSPTEKEGYQLHTSKTGKESYRRYYRNATGVLKSVGVFEREYGPNLSITLETDSVTYYLQFGLNDQRGFIDSEFASSLIKKLPYLEKGETITVNPYNFVPRGSKFSSRGVSIKKGALKVEDAFKHSYYPKGTTRLVEGDIPPIVWKEDPFTKKNKPTTVSLQNVSDFYQTTLLKELERLGYEGGAMPSNTAPTDNAPIQTSKPSPAKEEPEYSNEVDDLPF